MNKQLGKKIGAIGIVLTGIMAIVFGIICWCYWDSYSYYGDYVSYETYGGDAYTGIQNAAADTANNINDLISVIGYATSTLINYMGYLIFTIGVCYLSLVLQKCLVRFKKKQKLSKIHKTSLMYNNKKYYKKQRSGKLRCFSLFTFLTLSVIRWGNRRKILFSFSWILQATE